MGTFGGAQPIVTDGLVFAVDAANYQSYPGSGTTWSDLSRNDNDGSIYNTPDYKTTYAGGLEFDGTNQYYQFDYNQNLTTESFAVDIWFTPNQNTGYLQGILSCSDTRSTVMSPGWGIGFADNSSMRIEYGMYDEVNDVRYLMYRSVTLEVGVPVNLFIYRNLNTQKMELYVNGSFYNSITVPNTATIEGHRNYLNYKRWSYDAYPNATYHIIKVYHDKEFSTEEISQNYNALKGRFGL